MKPRLRVKCKDVRHIQCEVTGLPGDSPASDHRALVAEAFRAMQTEQLEFEKHPAWNPAIWHPVALKLEEARYHLGLCAANAGNVRVLLASLSAFLAATRSSTLYMQSHDDAETPAHEAAYAQTREEYLQSAVCRFFKDLRDRTLHAAYPRLGVQIIGVPLDSESEGVTLVAQGSGPTEWTLETIQTMQAFVDRWWNPRSLGELGYRYEPRWCFTDVPEGVPSDLQVACQKYVDCLASAAAFYKVMLARQYGIAAPAAEDFWAAYDAMKQSSADTGGSA